MSKKREDRFTHVMLVLIALALLGASVARSRMENKIDTLIEQESTDVE